MQEATLHDILLLVCDLIKHFGWMLEFHCYGDIISWSHQKLFHVPLWIFPFQFTKQWWEKRADGGSHQTESKIFLDRGSGTHQSFIISVAYRLWLKVMKRHNISLKNSDYCHPQSGTEILTLHYWYIIFLACCELTCSNNLLMWEFISPIDLLVPKSACSKWYLGKGFEAFYR